MRHLYSWLLGGGLLLGLSACPMTGPEPSLQPQYRPLLMARAQLEQAVAALPPQALHNTGKIYLRGSYVLVNERYEGVHIIDNHDPAHPKPVAFVRIPGNVDLAMKGNLLYADSGPDLLTFDVSNPRQARLLHRVRDAVPELPMPEFGPLEAEYQPQNRPADAVVVGWRKL